MARLTYQQDTTTGDDAVQKSSGGAAHIAELMTPSGTGAARSVTTASQLTAAITDSVVDVSADVECWIEIGAAPTAVVGTSYRIIADVTYRFKFTSGDRIAARSLVNGTFWYKGMS